MKGKISGFVSRLACGVTCPLLWRTSFCRAVGHHRKYNEGDNGQAAEQGLEETELHVIQEEVHEACDEESATAYPYYERDGFSLELDFLVAMVALDGTVFPFRK